MKNTTTKAESVFLLILCASPLCTRGIPCAKSSATSGRQAMVSKAAPPNRFSHAPEKGGIHGNHKPQTEKELNLKIKITLPGSIRSKKNSKIATIIGGVNKPRRAMILPSKAYKKWEAVARQHAAFQFPGEPLTCPVSVKAMVYYKGQRPDLSGCLESVGDSCEGILWGDDKLIESWDGSRLEKDNANPRTEVEVVPYEE